MEVLQRAAEGGPRARLRPGGSSLVLRGVLPAVFAIAMGVLVAAVHDGGRPRSPR